MFSIISGLLVAAQEESVCLNSVCFTLKSLSSATESPVRTSSSVSVGMYRTSFELKSCLSAEEVYLSDKRVSIETASFVGPRGHCTVMVELRKFLRLEKGDAAFQLHA